MPTAGAASAGQARERVELSWKHFSSFDSGKRAPIVAARHCSAGGLRVFVCGSPSLVVAMISGLSGSSSRTKGANNAATFCP